MKDSDVRIELARLDERQKAERRARKSSDRAEERERRAEIGAVREAILAAAAAVEKGRLTYEAKQKEYDEHHNGLIASTQATVSKLVTEERFESLADKVAILSSAALVGGGKSLGIQKTIAAIVGALFLGATIGGLIVSLTHK